MENQIETIEGQLTIDDILEEFLVVNQSTFDKLMSLNLTLEAVEVTIVPIERRMCVRIKEFAGNTIKPHQKDRPLMMQNVSFDDHMKKYIPIGTRMKMADMTHLTPEILEEILSRHEPIEDINPEEIENEHGDGLQPEQCDEQVADDGVRTNRVQDL